MLECYYYNEYRKSVWNEYNSDVLPKLKILENKRKKELFKLFIVASIIIFLELIIGSSYLFLDPDGFMSQTVNPILLLILFIVLSMIIVYKNDSFVADIKNVTYSKLMSAFTNIKWHNSSNKGIDEQILQQSSLFPIFDSKSSDDCFEGNYKDINFKIDEIRLDGAGGKTVFKGLAICVTSNKRICNKTIIVEKGNWAKKGNNSTFFILYGILIFLLSIATIICFCALIMGFCNINFELLLLGLSIIPLALCIHGLFAEMIKMLNNELKIFNKENLQELKLEGIDFQKRYSAYSSDQVEGRYLITVAFMQRLLNLKTVFKAKYVKCSFVGDKIIFALPVNKNCFELGNLFTSITDTRFLKQFLEEIISIYIIIDTLKLDKKIGF